MQPETMQPRESSTFTDRELETEVAIMLRAGIIVSSAIVLAGGLWIFRQPGAPIPDVAHFHSVEPALRTVHGTVAAVFGRAPVQSRAIMQLGLMVLIATPVLRVALCAVGFLRQRSWLYVGVSVAVFAVLLWSLAPAIR